MAYLLSTFFAIYFVVWWLTLFLTLPFGVRTQQEEGERVPGTDLGAPVRTLMVRKLIWTTVLSAVFCAIGIGAYYAGLFNIARLSKLFGIPMSL